MKARNIASALYLLISVLEVSGHIFGWQEVNQYSKPLLMPILIYYLIERTAGKVYQYHLVLGGALIFAWIGDVLLIWEGELNFILGLSSFLLTQIGYIVIFRMDIRLTLKEIIFGKAHVLLPFVLYGGIFLYFLVPAVEVFMIFPITLYSFCLLFMSGSALLRNPEMHGYKMVLAGSLLFVLSDSVIAVNQFVGTVPYGGVWVMLSYLIAQYLIVEGIIRREFAG